MQVEMKSWSKEQVREQQHCILIKSATFQSKLRIELLNTYSTMKSDSTSAAISVKMINFASFLLIFLSINESINYYLIINIIIIMMMMIYSETGRVKTDGKWSGERSIPSPAPVQKGLSSWTPILMHCVCKPNLTEPLYINRNEEYGQNRNCPPGPPF